MERPKKRRKRGPVDDRSELKDHIMACESWESLHEVLRQYQKECQKDWPLEAGLKWSEEFCKGSKRPETFKDLFGDAVAEGIKMQQERTVEEQWNTLGEILTSCAMVSEMLPLIEGLIDCIAPYIEEKCGLAVTPTIDVPLGLSFLPVVVTPIALRRLQFVENQHLLCLTTVLEALGTREDVQNSTTNDIFASLDRDGDNVLSRKDLQVLRELRTPEGDYLDGMKLGLVTQYLEKADYQKFSQLVNHANVWTMNSCHTTNGDMFYYYVEPMVHKYIKARRAETGPNLLDVKADAKRTKKKLPVEDFIEIIGESHLLYQLFIPHLAQTLADSGCLVAAGADSSTSVGFEPYLSTLRWQLLMSLVNNKVLVPTCQGLWNIKSRFMGQTIEYKYRLSIERNGCSGWSDLSSRNGEKTYKIQGQPPAADGSYQFVLLPTGDKKSRYFIVCKLSSDLKTLEGQWGTEGFDQPMRGELKGARCSQTGGTAYVDSTGKQWDPQTALIVLLDKIIPQTRISDSQTVELSSLITNLLNDADTYVDNLMDLAFILVNPLLQISLLRHLCGYDRPWERTEYLSLALIRVAAIAPFHWRDGVQPPPFDVLFGRTEEGVLTLPDGLPKPELQQMFREHARAQAETCLPTMRNYILGQTQPHDAEGCWESNFLGMLINVLTAGHFIKKEAHCVANCLQVATLLPVNWVARQLADIVVNIATQKGLDFEPAMRYPVCDFLLNRAERDVWIHRRTAEFFRDSLFARDVRAHVIWPRGKDALYLTELALRGRLRCPLCYNVPFNQIYEDAVTIYDDVEGEPFMREKFQEKQIFGRLERSANMQFQSRRFDCPCHANPGGPTLNVSAPPIAFTNADPSRSVLPGPQPVSGGSTAAGSMSAPGSMPAPGRPMPPPGAPLAPVSGPNGALPSALPQQRLMPPPSRQGDGRGPSGPPPEVQAPHDGAAPSERRNGAGPLAEVHGGHAEQHNDRLALSQVPGVEDNPDTRDSRQAELALGDAATATPSFPGISAKSQLAPSHPHEPSRTPSSGSQRPRPHNWSLGHSGVQQAHPYLPGAHPREQCGGGSSSSQRPNPPDTGTRSFSGQRHSAHNSGRAASGVGTTSGSHRQPSNSSEPGRDEPHPSDRPPDSDSQYRNERPPIDSQRLHSEWPPDREDDQHPPDRPPDREASCNNEAPLADVSHSCHERLSIREENQHLDDRLPERDDFNQERQHRKDPVRPYHERQGRAAPHNHERIPSNEETERQLRQAAWDAAVEETPLSRDPDEHNSDRTSMRGALRYTQERPPPRDSSQHFHGRAGREANVPIGEMEGRREAPNQERMPSKEAQRHHLRPVREAPQRSHERRVDTSQHIYDRPQSRERPQHIEWEPMRGAPHNHERLEPQRRQLRPSGREPPVGMHERQVGISHHSHDRPLNRDGPPGSHEIPGRREAAHDHERMPSEASRHRLRALEVHERTRERPVGREGVPQGYDRSLVREAHNHERMSAKETSHRQLRAPGRSLHSQEGFAPRDTPLDVERPLGREAILRSREIPTSREASQYSQNGPPTRCSNGRPAGEPLELRFERPSVEAPEYHHERTSVRDVRQYRCEHPPTREGAQRLRERPATRECSQPNARMRRPRHFPHDQQLTGELPISSAQQAQSQLLRHLPPSEASHPSSSSQRSSMHPSEHIEAASVFMDPPVRAASQSVPCQPAHPKPCIKQQIPGYGPQSRKRPEPMLSEDDNSPPNVAKGSFSLPTELPFFKYGASLLPGGSVRGGMPPMGMMNGPGGFPLGGCLPPEKSRKPPP